MSCEVICDDCPLAEIDDKTARDFALLAVKLICYGELDGYEVEETIGLPFQAVRAANQCIKNQLGAPTFCLSGLERYCSDHEPVDN